MTDSELIRQIKEGNIELYSELIGRYEKKITGFIFNMLKLITWRIMLRISVKIHFIRHLRV